MPNVQHLEVASGETVTPTLEARDRSNVVANLSGKTISWSVGRSPWDPQNAGAIFTKSGTIVNAAAGTFSVPILPADTLYLSGDYEHIATTRDGSDAYAVVCRGRFRVVPTLVASA